MIMYIIYIIYIIYCLSVSAEVNIISDLQSFPIYNIDGYVALHVTSSVFDNPASKVWRCCQMYNNLHMARVRALNLESII